MLYINTASFKCPLSSTSSHYLLQHAPQNLHAKSSQCGLLCCRFEQTAWQGKHGSWTASALRGHINFCCTLSDDAAPVTTASLAVSQATQPMTKPTRESTALDSGNRASRWAEPGSSQSHSMQHAAAGHHSSTAGHKQNAIVLDQVTEPILAGAAQSAETGTLHPSAAVPEPVAMAIHAATLPSPGAAAAARPGRTAAGPSPITAAPTSPQALPVAAKSNSAVAITVATTAFPVAADASSADAAGSVLVPANPVASDPVGLPNGSNSHSHSRHHLAVDPIILDPAAAVTQCKDAVTGCARQLDIKLVPATHELVALEFALYRKYQLNNHGDKPHKVEQDTIDSTYCFCIILHAVEGMVANRCTLVGGQTLAAEAHLTLESFMTLAF